MGAGSTTAPDEAAPVVHGAPRSTEVPERIGGSSAAGCTWWRILAPCALALGLAAAAVALSVPGAFGHARYVDEARLAGRSDEGAPPGIRAAQPARRPVHPRFARRFSSPPGYAVPTKVVALPARGSQAARSYDWPLKPFDRPHPVRAFINDPRIASATERNFHIGIDIGTPGGTPVYAIEAGLASLAYHVPDGTVVRVASGRRTFEYWHLVPAVGNQQWVERHALIGRTLPTYNHVHLSEDWDGRRLNPLRPGALGPYADHTSPTTTSIWFRAAGTRRDPAALHGTVDVVAESFDVVPDVAPHPWIVTPGLLQWRLLKGGRIAMPWRTAHDFRSAVLPPSAFGWVYASGTRANHRGRRGHFSFYLAHGWQTRGLPNGPYTIEVEADDARGNTGLSYFPVTIVN